MKKAMSTELKWLIASFTYKKIDRFTLSIFLAFGCLLLMFFDKSLRFFIDSF